MARNDKQNEQMRQKKTTIIARETTMITKETTMIARETTTIATEKKNPSISG